MNIWQGEEKSRRNKDSRWYWGVEGGDSSVGRRDVGLEVSLVIFVSTERWEGGASLLCFVWYLTQTSTQDAIVHF